MRIAVVAPSCPLDPTAVPILEGRARAAGVDLDVHPQCFSRSGHFAGADAERLSALLEVLGNDSVDGVWFARGGYGSNRIAETAAASLPATSRAKLIMGYSDAGFLLSALHRAGVSVAHGPLAQDALREGGSAAVDRALAYFKDRDPSALEGDIADDRPTLAVNLEVLVSMLGTPIAPRLAGCELLIEEVAEHLYAIDRAMFMLTSQQERPASLRLGRVSDVPPNDPDFGEEVEAMVRRWCARGGIDYRGRADIGHDADNKVVPFSPR